MSDYELDMWVAFICAAYGGTPATVEQETHDSADTAADAAAELPEDGITTAFDSARL